MKWSVNKKLNAALQGIEDDLLEILDTKEESLRQVERYVKDFPREPDCNLVNYGNLLIYYANIREFYISCGYSYENINRKSDNEIWETYRKQVGYVAREIIKEYERNKQVCSSKS